MVEGRRIERYVDDTLTDALDLPERYQGRLPALSPDNCSAAFRAGDRDPHPRRRLLAPGPEEPGLPRPRRHLVAGRQVDRRSAAPTNVLFTASSPAEDVTWPIGAVQIVWRRS